MHLNPTGVALRSQVYLKHGKMGDAVDDNWEKNAGKKATRIWEWWRSIAVDESTLPCFSSSLQLIVPVQVSSCAVKQVFTQMKYVVYVCGNVYEYHLKVLMFDRCNSNLQPLWVKTLNNYLAYEVSTIEI